jgi:DNA helicase-2/ATP-dependent DNA helicase PcrA
MDKLLKQKEELNINKIKYQRKLFVIENQLIQIEKEMAKFSEETLIDSLTLSDQQKSIVDANEQNILVIACPGAGKTHTLISRYINLVLKLNIKPEEVLLITFTKKAGQEMLKRLEDIIPNKLPFHVGSLHGLSYRILQKYNNINYTVLDEKEARELLKYEANIILSTSQIDIDDINMIKIKICTIMDQVAITYPLNFKIILKKFNLTKYNNIINQIYKGYSKKKKQENYIDFNDLMIMFCDFLKSSKSDEFKNQIKYIFFDEYQDINPIQNYILSIFKNKANIMVVGDDAQSIYSFRGSSVNFILDFPSIFQPNKKYLLVENYRSTPSIVNLCENIISKNTNQYEKNVKSIQTAPGVLPDIIGFDLNNIGLNSTNFTSNTKNITPREEQYKWIINDIKNKIQNNVKLSDIVILARKNDLLNNIELELIANKIPFVKQLGLSLLDKHNIKDFLAFIIVLNNPKSSIHWKRIINLHSGWNINTASALVESSNNIYEKIKEISNINNEMLELICFFNQIKQINKDKDKAQFILNYLEKLWLNKYKQSQNYSQDILSLLYYLRNSSLNDFIADLYLNQDIESTSENVIFLSTVHGSKGLEWNHVYLMDMNNTDFPSVKQQYFTNELDEMEEERRLFYVACSRAKKYLTITYHTDSKTNMSPFIRELDDKYFLGNNINYASIDLINNIPKDITNLLKNYGHHNICSLIKNLNTKEKILNNEMNIPVTISKFKNKQIIGNFIDYLIPKILQNNYPEKLKKFNLNLIHRYPEFSKKIYHEYIDENCHWLNLLENIFYISKYNYDTNNEIDIIKDFLLSNEQTEFYKELEMSIKKMVEMFKPKTIYSHYNINFDLLKAEIDLVMDDVLVEIKVSSNEICNLTYLSQTFTYAYLMFKKGIKINKVCLYNVQNGIINIIDTSTFDFKLFYEKLFLL